MYVTFLNESIACYIGFWTVLWKIFFTAESKNINWILLTACLFESSVYIICLGSILSKNEADPYSCSWFMGIHMYWASHRSWLENNKINMNHNGRFVL